MPTTTRQQDRDHAAAYARDLRRTGARAMAHAVVLIAQARTRRPEARA
jgi:hypothetical protein